MAVTREQAIMLTRDLLVSEFGEVMRTRAGDQVVLRSNDVREYDDAWLVPFNTRTYLDGGPPPTGLLPAAAVVPKDSNVAPHYSPTALSVGDYLAKVRSGEMKWASPPVDRVTYYARISERAPRARPKGLLRRRLVGGTLLDERFVGSLLRWEPTDFFELQRLGRNDDDYVEVTEGEADAFIERLRVHVQST